jgi:hypothetical protein
MKIKMKIVIGVVAIIVGGVLAVKFLGPEIEAQCGLQGFGDGKCKITNRGYMTSEACFYVRLVRLADGATLVARKVCSGRIAFRESKAVDFDMPEIRSFESSCRYSDRTTCALQVR